MIYEKEGYVLVLILHRLLRNWWQRRNSQINTWCLSASPWATLYPLPASSAPAKPTLSASVYWPVTISTFSIPSFFLSPCYLLFPNAFTFPFSAAPPLYISLSSQFPLNSTTPQLLSSSLSVFFSFLSSVLPSLLLSSRSSLLLWFRFHFFCSPSLISFSFSSYFGNDLVISVSPFSRLPFSSVFCLVMSPRFLYLPFFIQFSFSSYFISCLFYLFFIPHCLLISFSFPSHSFSPLCFPPLHCLSSPFLIVPYRAWTPASVKVRFGYDSFCTQR